MVPVFGEDLKDRWVPPYMASLDEAYISTIIDELPAVGIQLQAKNRDFWDTYDRRLSEAQFRTAISSPMIVLSCILAVTSGQFLWLALLVYRSSW